MSSNKLKSIAAVVAFGTTACAAPGVILTDLQWFAPSSAAQPAPAVQGGQASSVPTQSEPCAHPGPEDYDGWRDDDGCADPDNDGDGILDGADGAPLEPEDLDGYEDLDGVPDPVHVGASADPSAPAAGSGGAAGAGEGSGSTAQSKSTSGRDGAGSAASSSSSASADEAPVAAGALSGTADADADGVLDAYDSCVNEPEDKDGFQDGDGCPDPDNDEDGTPDASDACPDEPGSGCNSLEIKGSIFFRPGSDKMLLRKSRSALKQVLKAMRERTEIKLLEIQGHTDNVGRPAGNRALSDRRAAAVKKYLVGKGVASDRLTSKGYGDEKPIAPNTTRPGRAKNRRVEFVVLK